MIASLAAEGGNKMNRKKQMKISPWVLLLTTTLLILGASMANAKPSKTVAWTDGQTVGKWPSSVLNNDFF